MVSVLLFCCPERVRLAWELVCFFAVEPETAFFVLAGAMQTGIWLRWPLRNYLWSARSYTKLKPTNLKRGPRSLAISMPSMPHVYVQVDVVLDDVASCVYLYIYIGLFYSSPRYIIYFYLVTGTRMCRRLRTRKPAQLLYRYAP